MFRMLEEDGRAEANRIKAAKGVKNAKFASMLPCKIKKNIKLR